MEQKIYNDNDPVWKRIQAHCTRMSNEALIIQRVEFESWGYPWSTKAVQEKKLMDILESMDSYKYSYCDCGN